MMSTTPISSSTGDVIADLAACAREPIHIPGSIQPHGTLLVLTPNLKIEAAASNAQQFLGQPAETLIGKPLVNVLNADLVQRLRDTVAGQSGSPVFIFTHVHQDIPLNVVAHHHDDRIILEFEPASATAAHASNTAATFQSLYPTIRDSMQRLEGAGDVRELYATAAEDVRRIAGFDRVMIYAFDADWHGWVVGEARSPDVASYMDHHFPASDIPEQARELYRSNRSRVIVDTGYQPAPLIGKDSAARPIDLSFALLRSVSPVHVEYLNNMGVGASTSFSIIRNGKLWGLIACHHRTALHVPFEVRTACEFLAQVLGMQIGAQERRRHDEHLLRLQAAQTRLLAAMTPEENLRASLLAAGPQLLDFMSAGGAALYFNNEITLLEATPSEEQVQQILDMLILKEDQDLWSTESLPAVMPSAETLKDTAAGVLAMRISQFVNSYILWFRPEKLRTIRWGGDPNKPALPAPVGSGRIHPRKSFQQWIETIRNRSDPWLREELDAAVEFRSAVVNIVLRKVEELAGMNAQLKRANSELEAFSYSVSHDLRAPFRHISGFSDLLARRTAASLDETSQRYVKVIGDAARHAGKLVDALLAFAHISRVQLQKRDASLAEMLQNVQRNSENEIRGRNVQFKIDLAPDATIAHGDPTLLQLVLQNLVSNALKFTRHQPATIIEVTSRIESVTTGDAPGRRLVVRVRDNGIGFDNKFAHKLFSPFQRLHREDEFEGTGIGLANVKRIIERHGGTATAEGTPNAGATITFTLPLQENP